MSGEVDVNRDGYTDDPVVAAEMAGESGRCPYFSVRGLSMVFPLRYIADEMAIVDTHGHPLADLEYGGIPVEESHVLGRWIADAMNEAASATREAEEVVARMPD